MSADLGVTASVAAVRPERLALCLSGGGYRAALFHLGALRRLNELGVLSKMDMICSVSGGSILAAHLATHLRPWPQLGVPFANWQDIEERFRQFVRHDIRTWPVLKRFLFPWNWFRPSTQVRTLKTIYKKRLTALKLSGLPDRPQFAFCATDLVNGVSWVFEKTRVGSYKAGYLEPVPNWHLARAVAASSCFPPVFDPLPIRIPEGTTVVDGIDRPKEPFTGMCVNDGGLYDNLGLQPAEQCRTVLVSDGGAPFIAAVPHGLIGRLKAYLSVIGRQAGALRVRTLIAEFTRRERAGSYWGIESAPERYQREPPPPGYSKALATSRIATIRTDLDAFSHAEIAVLVNHGYFLADIALHVHARELLGPNVPPAVAPHPEWMDETKVEAALRYSDRRFAIVRWISRVFRLQAESVQLPVDF